MFAAVERIDCHIRVYCAHSTTINVCGYSVLYGVSNRERERENEKRNNLAPAVTFH